MPWSRCPCRSRASRPSARPAAISTPWPAGTPARTWPAWSRCWRPGSVAAAGASRRPGSLGRTVLLNIRDAGFAGRLYAVGPHARDIAGIPCVPSVAALPEPPDLAVVTVPATHVVDVARECEDCGVRSLVVVTAGLTPAQESGLLEATRRGGMRLAAPASHGIAVPGIGLAATPASGHKPSPRPGSPPRTCRAAPPRCRMSPSTAATRGRP